MSVESCENLTSGNWIACICSHIPCISGGTGTVSASRPSSPPGLMSMLAKLPVRFASLNVSFISPMSKPVAWSEPGMSWLITLLKPSSCSNGFSCSESWTFDSISAACDFRDASFSSFGISLWASSVWSDCILSAVWLLCAASTASAGRWTLLSVLLPSSDKSFICCVSSAVPPSCSSSKWFDSGLTCSAAPGLCDSDSLESLLLFVSCKTEGASLLSAQGASLVHFVQNIVLELITDRSGNICIVSSK